MRVFFALIGWIGAIATAAEVSTVVADSAHTSAVAASFDASNVTATDAHSLFRTANFSRVLALARTHLGSSARVERVVIYPGYLDVTAVRPGIDIYINAVGTYEPTTTPANPGDMPLFSITRVTADAPAAIAQRIAPAAHVPESQLRYIIAERDSSTHRFHWLIYTQPGSGVEYLQTSGPDGPLFELRANSSTGLQRIQG